MVGWTAANVHCRLRDGVDLRVAERGPTGSTRTWRTAAQVYFDGHGLRRRARSVRFEAHGDSGATVAGPAIIESAFTTVVLDPGRVRPSGGASAVS